MSHEIEGCYGVVIEKAGQDPILLECEAPYSTPEHARLQAKRMLATRYCVVRLVPEYGNELLLQDMVRLQRPIEEDTF